MDAFLFSLSSPWEGGARECALKFSSVQHCCWRARAQRAPQTIVFPGCGSQDFRWDCVQAVRSGAVLAPCDAIGWARPGLRSTPQCRFRAHEAPSFMDLAVRRPNEQIFRVLPRCRILTPRTDRLPDPSKLRSSSKASRVRQGQCCTALVPVGLNAGVDELDRAPPGAHFVDASRKCAPGGARSNSSSVEDKSETIPHAPHAMRGSAGLQARMAPTSRRASR